jgi:hypothetical protein
MCGFAPWTHDGELSTQADGCVELNGCASFFIYPYLKCFTLLITFVFLNLFVGIILDGFSQVCFLFYVLERVYASSEISFEGNSVSCGVDELCVCATCF